jgi:hypothetical protein
MHFSRFYSKTIGNQRISVEFGGGRFTLTPVDCDLLVVPACKADIEFSSELSRNCARNEEHFWRGEYFVAHALPNIGVGNLCSQRAGLRVASVVVGRKSKPNILKKIN